MGIWLRDQDSMAHEGGRTVQFTRGVYASGRVRNKDKVRIWRKA